MLTSQKTEMILKKNDHKIIDKNVRSIYNRDKQKEPMPAKTPTLKGSTPILPN